jgi:DNA repair exonuclease SbcCD ATPase subunit
MPGMYKYSMEIESNVKKLLLDTKELQDRMDTLEGKEYKINLNIDEKKLGNVISNLEKMLDSLGKGTGDFKQFENLSKELSNIVSEVQSLSKAFGKVDDSGAKTLLSSIQNIDKSLSELSQNILNVNKNMSNMGGNTSGAVKQVENISDAYQNAAKEAEELADAQSKIGQKTNISSGTKDAIPSTEATASVEKTTQAIREENNALDETVSKAKQAASELTKTRDIVSQNWYREKGTVVGKDSKGNDITRDADEFSFVERLKNGQLQTVLATYDEETGKWAEQVINVRTAFEQVEKAIISADNKIASLEIAKERTLASHPGYDATADDNQIAIERKKRDELQATLNLYGSEKEYVFEIEAATKRIADNQKRLNNKKQSQTNLRQAVSDEKDAKANEQANKRDAKQAQIEAENIKLAEQKSIYNELIDSIDRYSTVSKRIESGKAFEGDYEEAARLQEKIEELQNNPILSQEQLDASQRKLEKIETTLEDIATAKEKSDSIKVDSENVKNIQAEWDKNIKAIQDYMDAMTKLNNLKAKDKGTGSEANQIALQTQNVEELKQAAWDARKNLFSIQAENPDIIAWKQWVDMMKLFDQASKGSAESAAKLKDVLDNIKAPSLDKYENKLASYQTKKGAYNATIARFNDGGWTSDEYLKNVQAVKDAVNEYETLLNELKGKDASLVTSDDISKLDEYEKKIKDAIATVTNMSAAEKGYNFVSGQKELDKIHKLLNENSKMSSEAKAKIKAYYTEIESGNPSMSLDRIHGEIMKIYNAEVEAGRAGRSFFDTLKNSGFHQLAAQMSGMFGFYDVINVIKQAASTVIELNTQITELAKVSEQSSSQIYADFDSYANIAKEVRGTISDTIAATADWSKNGYSIPDAKQLAEVSQLYKNVGDGIDINTANESLISTLKGFKLEADQAEHIVDVFNEVSNNEAISSGGIGEALQRSAASFNAANTSLEKSVALVTATNSVLQDPEKVGNMWKTVSARIRGKIVPIYSENYSLCA